MISFVPFNSSQVPWAIAWALVCPCELSHDLPALIARLKSALVLICAFCAHAVYFSILLPLKLGLGALCWLLLGVACFLPTAGGFAWLLLSSWLPQCLFALVGHW